jgi:alkaline phosphatase D
MKSIFIALLLLAPLFLSAQLKSDPMLGYADMKEVLIWVQTNQASLVHIQNQEIGDKIIH